MDNKIPSLDEMIESGKTLSEIQREVRKRVAARDEAMLAAQKEAINKEKIEKARAAASKAVVEYCVALGLSDENGELTKTMNKSLYEYEKNLEPWLKVFNKVPKDKKNRSSLDDYSLETALEQLKLFADSL